MKTTLKRVLSMALALVLLVGVLPMAALAISEEAPVYEHGPYTTTAKFSSDLEDGTKHGWYCDFPYCRHASSHVESELHFDNNCDGVCDHSLCNATGFAGAGHNLTDVAAQAATCTADGYSAHKACSKCNYTEGKTVDPAGHNFGNNEPACLRCGTKNTNYVPPVVKGDATILVRVNEAGTTTQMEGGSFTIATNTAGQEKPASAIRDAYSLSSIAEYTPGKILSFCVTDNNGGNRITGNETMSIVAGNTYILWIEVPAAPPATSEPTTPPATSEPTTPPATSEPTTPPATSEPTTPNKYNVYYNVNVDEDSKVNKPFGTYEEGTRLSTIVQTLKAMEGSTIKFPGLFETWFAVEGWYVDGIKVTDADTRPLTRNTIFYAKWYQKYNYEVVLKLYTNGNTNNVVKVIDAFKYVQDDGRLSHTEVTNIAKEYIEPNNDAGLTVYGPFDANGWEQYSLYPNRLTNTEYVTVNRNGTTVVHAMVHNAKIYNSTSSTNKKADSSNPKTGDMIMMPAAVMSVSVSALAVMFYLKKKRTV